MNFEECINLPAVERAVHMHHGCWNDPSEETPQLLLVSWYLLETNDLASCTFQQYTLLLLCCWLISKFIKLIKTTLTTAFGLAILIFAQENSHFNIAISIKIFPFTTWQVFTLKDIGIYKVLCDTDHSCEITCIIKLMY